MAHGRTLDRRRATAKRCGLRLPRRALEARSAVSRVVLMIPITLANEKGTCKKSRINRTRHVPTFLGAARVVTKGIATGRTVACPSVDQGHDHVRALVRFLELVDAQTEKALAS